MRIYDRDSFRIRYRDVVWLDANQLPILLMCIVNSFEALTTPALIQKPEIGERGRARAGDVTNGMRADVRKEIEEER